MLLNELDCGIERENPTKQMGDCKALPISSAKSQHIFGQGMSNVT